MPQISYGGLRRFFELLTPTMGVEIGFKNFKTCQYGSQTAANSALGPTDMFSIGFGDVGIPTGPCRHFSHKAVGQRG